MELLKSCQHRTGFQPEAVTPHSSCHQLRELTALLEAIHYFRKSKYTNESTYSLCSASVVVKKAPPWGRQGVDIYLRGQQGPLNSVRLPRLLFALVPRKERLSLQLFRQFLRPQHCKPPHAVRCPSPLPTY